MIWLLSTAPLQVYCTRRLQTLAAGTKANSVFIDLQHACQMTRNETISSMTAQTQLLDEHMQATTCSQLTTCMKPQHLLHASNPPDVAP